MKLRKIHELLGVILCVPLLWISLSGSVLSLWDFLLPAEKFSFATKTWADPADRIAFILQKSPLSSIKGIRFSHSASEADQLKLQEGPDLFLHPATQEILPAKEERGKKLKKIIVELHRGKFFLTPGRAVWSFLGAALILLVGTGLGLYRRKAKRKLLSALGLHQKLALLSALPLFLLLFSGSLWNFSEELRGEKQEATTPAPNWESALRLAQKIYPNHSEPVGIYPVRGKILVLFQDSGRVYVEGKEARVYDPKNWSGYLELLFRIHTGQIWGLLFPFLVGIFGVALALSGAWLWFKKKLR